MRVLTIHWFLCIIRGQSSQFYLITSSIILYEGLRTSSLRTPLWLIDRCLYSLPLGLVKTWPLSFDLHYASLDLGISSYITFGLIFSISLLDDHLLKITTVEALVALAKSMLVSKVSYSALLLVVENWRCTTHSIMSSSEDFRTL